MHSDDKFIRMRLGYVIALLLGSGGQHDVRHARTRRPEALLDYEGIELFKRAREQIRIGVVHIRVSARPVGKLDVGISYLFAVKIYLLTGIIDTIDDARDGDCDVVAVFPLALASRHDTHAA